MSTKKIAHPKPAAKKAALLADELSQHMAHLAEREASAKRNAKPAKATTKPLPGGAAKPIVELSDEQVLHATTRALTHALARIKELERSRDRALWEMVEAAAFLDRARAHADDLWDALEDLAIAAIAVPDAARASDARDARDAARADMFGLVQALRCGTRHADDAKRALKRGQAGILEIAPSPPAPAA